MARRIVLVSLCLTAAGATAEDQGPYPATKLLVQPVTLKRLVAVQLVQVLDVRSKAAYDDGHVPTAVRTDAADWKALSKRPDGLTDEAPWARHLGSLGIRRDRPVVIYGATLSPAAARVWWLLRYAGHPDVRLLDGGFQAWKASGGRVEKVERSFPPGEFQPRFQKRLLADLEAVKKFVAGKGATLVDSRSREEFDGKRRLGARAGSIPGAKPLEWKELLTKEGRLKPAEELRKLFADRGVSLEGTAVTYCQSGGRAAVTAFVLELMGAKDVKNYYGSWAEWSRDEDAPVEGGSP